MKKLDKITLDPELADPMDKLYSDLLDCQAKRRKRLKVAMGVLFVISIAFGWGLAEAVRSHF